MYTENNKFDVIIVGGGAGGLAAAVCCAKKANKSKGLRIAVLEKEPKPCKKLLATGNGKCNLTNMNMSEKYYNTSAQSFIKPLLSKYTPQKLIKFWESRGLFCVPDEYGRVYPNSGQAVSVADTLLINLKKYNTELFCNTEVKKITKVKGGFAVGCTDKEYFCKKLIISAGGFVQPNLGSNGSGYSLAKDLNLSCTPLFPSLAPVLCKDKLLSVVKGVRCNAVVKCIADGKVIHTEKGELQFNEKNISGICIFQLSRHINEFFSLGSVLGRPCRKIQINADLLPDIAYEEIFSALTLRRRLYPDSDAAEIFCGLLNKKLSRYLCLKLNINEKLSAGDLSDDDLSAFASLSKECTFIPCAPSLKENAQVTAGGVSLAEINKNMECKKYKGLYIIGETLDIDGLCGGYNLHWAFISGIIAGHNAAAGDSLK